MGCELRVGVKGAAVRSKQRQRRDTGAMRERAGTEKLIRT